jgi:hypothetical protein
MSTFVDTKAPLKNTKWCVLNAYFLKAKIISPKFTRLLFDKGYRFIYISYGNIYSEAQNNYQKTLSHSQYDILNEGVPVMFSAVIIDSLNPCRNSIRKMIPSKMYIKGNEYEWESYNKDWDESMYINPFKVNEESIKAKIIFNRYNSFKNEPFSYCFWFYNDVIFQILDIKREPSPQEKLELKLKQERDSCKFGKIIELISKYSVKNWICITKNVNLKNRDFTTVYNRFAQYTINEYQLKYTFDGNVFDGGSVVKPKKSRERFEFQHFFNFSAHCANYDPEKTRYFYNSTMNLTKNSYNSIYTFLEPYNDRVWDKDLYKFIIWCSINYLGILNSHRENEFIRELSKVMNLEELTAEEINELIYPVS